MTMKAICDECGKEFDIRPNEYRKNQHHYCSVYCRRKVLRKVYMDRFHTMVGHKYRLIEYADKKNVTVECLVCGDVFTRTSTAILRGECQQCKRMKAQRHKQHSTLNNQLNRAVLKMLNAKRKELDAMADRMSKAIERAERKKEMDMHRSEKRRQENKVRELRRECRIKNNGVFDRDITVDKLFLRDKGVCSLCGGMCDFKDYRLNESGHFIVGDKYPSIDHTIPLSRGGTHTWNNVQLAHFKCNTIKGNRTTAPYPRSGLKLA